MFNFDKVNLLKVIGVLVIFVILFFIFNKDPDKNNLDLFAQNYASFRNQQYETFIFSQVPITDTSNKTGKENYFTYLENALDRDQTNVFRKNNAQEALSMYETINKKMMDGFSEQIRLLGLTISYLVESANRIENKEYIIATNEISKYARQIHQNYENIRLQYEKNFEFKNDLLLWIISNGGDISAFGPILKDKSSQILETNNELEKLFKETNDISNKMDDLYLSLKGRTNLKYYPNKFKINK